MNLREFARPKLTLRYDAVHAQRTDPERASPDLIPTAELRRLVAEMID